ncbi:MAG: hypothetical protein WHS44_09220 [Fimbriimonadales bacterium]|nr:MAG: hypothetical protein KatS3mg018_1183 [Fimbriimonadales bacterium]
MCRILALMCLAIGLLYLMEAAIGVQFPHHRWKWRLLTRLEFPWRMGAAATAAWCLILGASLLLVCGW